MDFGTQNEHWAYLLVDALVAQGVDYFCCAPGARSTPLLLAIARHPKAEYIVHFDERAVCFHAAGYGKGAGRPAAVVATSGTAIGNLMPGIMESSNDRIPMIILSADRPPELRDCGANQTCDQVKLFSNFVRWQVDLPCPDDRIPEGYLASTISHAVAMASYPIAGPVHINCMFREPLLSDHAAERPMQRHVHFEAPVLHPSQESIRAWQQTLAVKRRGVIVVGSCRSDISEAVFALANALKWPVFADALSSLRGPHVINHFDPILKLNGSIKAEAVIQFGDRFASKTLSTWMETQTPEFFLHVADHPMRQDPGHLITHRVQASPHLFTREVLSSLTPQEDREWLSMWQGWDEKCKERLDTFFSAQEHLTEPGLVWEIGQALLDEWCLFAGTSMPVRDINQFFNPRMKPPAVFGNRGVSGIDGIIATACGIAQGKKRPTLALIGDLTLLHDLTSLAMVAKAEHPVILIVVNNGGGGIFSFLPVSKRKEAFEEFIAAAHGITFASAAALFDLPYFHFQTPRELRDALARPPQSCLIEITTDREENVLLHQQILKELCSCLKSSTAEIPAFLH